MNPTLHLVSVPIGNPLDLNLRAMEVLKTADLIIGEEYKETAKFLKRNGIQKDFELLNEHSSEEEIYELFEKLKQSESTCLFSDSGTPLLEDPGLRLVQYCIQNEIKISSVPGPAAFLTALTLSGFPVSPFVFLGFLPKDALEKKKYLTPYLSLKQNIVFYETPYRYKKTIQEISGLVSGNKNVFLGLNLTAEDEHIFRGKWKDLGRILDSLPKAPPVIVIHNF